MSRNQGRGRPRGLRWRRWRWWWRRKSCPLGRCHERLLIGQECSNLKIHPFSLLSDFNCTCSNTFESVCRMEYPRRNGSHGHSTRAEPVNHTLKAKRQLSEMHPKVSNLPGTEHTREGGRAFSTSNFQNLRKLSTLSQNVILGLVEHFNFLNLFQ